MSRKRATEVLANNDHASCDACPWHLFGAGALGNAAQHHDKTGHPVTIAVERTVRYGDTAAINQALEDAGQLTIPGDP